MCDNLLSPLHIQKLAHSIEEIRVRALASVISKYNLNLVDESNLENTKLLLEKLLNWFNFEKYSDAEKVLNLILKIFKYDNADLIIKEIGVNDLLRKIGEINKKTGYTYTSLVQNINQSISEIDIDKQENFLQNGRESKSFSESESVKLPSRNIDGGGDRDRNRNAYKNCQCATKSLQESNKELHRNDYKLGVSERPSKAKENGLVESPIENNLEGDCIFKVEYFPWQHLISEDKDILSSVYDGLRYIDNKNSILQSCQFYSEVLLRDFPAEVLIQRPLIVRTFLQLIESTGEDIRISILKCLTKTVQCLKGKIQCALNTSLFSLKPEFYSTFSFFPNLSSSEDGSSECLELLQNKAVHEDFHSDNDYDVDYNIKKYQLSLSEFCFEILFSILPCLGKKCSQRETNSVFVLSYETLTCLTLNMKGGIWYQQNDVRKKFYKIFGIIQELLKYHKEKSQIIYVALLNVTMKLLVSLKPPSSLELGDILPRGLQVELAHCVSDYALVFMFPQLHSEILKIVEKLPGHKEKEIVSDYTDVVMIFQSMKSSMKFLKSSKFRTKMEKLECVMDSLPSLDFHQNIDFIHLFLSSCLLKWSKSQLKDEELKIQTKILLKLLSHSNSIVQSCIYKGISKCAVKLLGTEEAANPEYEFPGDKLDFLFQTDVLTEIICHGLNSSTEEVQRYSNDIVVHLLKSKFVMSEICWCDFVKALIPCLGLLQCYAEKSTLLGRCIIKLFDPDVARSNGFPLIEILKGNIRFLYSKNNLVRDEAISRLFWLLSKEDLDGKKLPRMSILTGLNLSGICSSVKPKDFTRIRQSFYNPGRLCDVLEMLNTDNVEPNLRRSALSQISVMMDDVHLHSTFLEQKGLDKILRILENCLIEKEFRNYPDSVIPIVDILKILCLHNVCVRQELSTQINVFYCVLRSLFLFSSDETLRQNAVELLCLLLYSDCILRVPTDKSIKCTISFPEIVVTRMCLPFLTHIHWRNSRHLDPSLKKTIASKGNCLKLINVGWAIQYVGNLSDLLSMQASDIKEKASSPGIPEDMKISSNEVECLKICAFGLSVKQTLYDIQNATTHEGVLFCIQKLHSYFLLYETDKKSDEKGYSDISLDKTLSYMLWESTLERFTASVPSCVEDESLLLEVVRFIQLLLNTFKSKRLIDWVERLIIDEHQSLFIILKSIGNETFGIKGRELRLAVIELTQQIVSLKCNVDNNKWFLYMTLISDHLKLENKKEFYNVVYVDWFLALLLDLTGRYKWSFEGKGAYLESLIIRIMEIIIAFHCTKDSVVTFMGMNIIKNALSVLNHLLSDSRDLKNWERLWFEALTKVVGSKEKNVNYCWLLSLWFMRDSVLRAAAFQLFVGFSSTNQSCNLLISQLNMQLDHIWNCGLKILFDENECSFVKEKCALLLSNFLRQGLKVSVPNFFRLLEDINIYQEVLKIIENYQDLPKLTGVTLEPSSNVFKGEMITTPSLITSTCIFLQSIISLNASEVSDKILESSILDCLIKTLGDIPEAASTCGKHHYSRDVLEMYVTVCRLISKCISSSIAAFRFVLQSQNCLNRLFSMVNYNLYCPGSEEITFFKTDLWSEILNIFSFLLVENPESNKNNNKESTGFIALNRSMTENGIDYFISSLYIALSSEEPGLRSAVIGFLTNLFHHEMATKKHASISDVLERKIFPNALIISKRHGWNGFNISEELTLHFGIRACDLLIQIFSLNSDCPAHCFKKSVVSALGSLLAVYKPAQNYAIDKGLADQLIAFLKRICVKLNLENVENFKKLSDKKKLDPLLVEVENLFEIMSNFMFNNEKAKIAFADCALSAVVLKLWPWCIAKQTLLTVTLKMLSTFTHSCDQGCRTLVFSANLSALGLKKTSGSLTLMNAITNQIITEMDLISKTHDSVILCLCLQILSNCCGVTECRSIISKGNFLQSCTKLQSNSKKRCYGESVIKSWLEFFVVFSSHQEGQLALTKNQEVLDLIIFIFTSSKCIHRLDALIALRNLCFHQLNRVRILSCCSFLSLMFETLDSKNREEMQTVVVMIWALACNSQKAKLILRSSGFESKLESLKKSVILKEDMKMANLIETVLGIFKNK